MQLVDLKEKEFVKQEDSYIYETFDNFDRLNYSNWERKKN